MNEEKPRHIVQISSGAFIWIFLFSGGPMIAFGLVYALALLQQETNSTFWNILGIGIGGLGFAAAIGMLVAAIAWFNLLWAHRTTEAYQKYLEHWQKLTGGRPQPKWYSLRFLTGYMLCFVAMIPCGIVVSILGVVNFYVGLACYLVFIPLAYAISRRVLYRVVFGITFNE